MNKYERTFKLMVEHGLFPNVWGGKVFVEGFNSEVLLQDYPNKFEAVAAVIEFANEERQ